MSIEDDIALLQRVPTLAVLGKEALRIIAIGAESRTLRRGEVLFREGDPADAGYVVEEGRLTAVTKNRNTQPVIIERGVLLGELALVTETLRPATVTAADTTSVMRIARPLFLKMLQGYPDVAERLRAALAQRSEQLCSELGRVRDAFERLAAADRSSSGKGTASTGS
jgi:CRP-like cAMP-binding protein